MSDSPTIPANADEPIRVVDHQLLEVLRSRPSVTVNDLAAALEVTATAVRIRLERMLDAGLIERRKMVSGRGRPTFTYALTVQGHRHAGADYAMLADAMWQEILALPDVRWKRKLLRRVAQRLGRQYAEQLTTTDRSIEGRLQDLSRLLGSKKIPAEVQRSGSLPVLDLHICPYPDLTSPSARREMCHLEEEMLSEALGEQVQLSRCRLDGDSCCQFTPVPRTPALDTPTVCQEET